MKIGTAIAIYFIIWWIVLFAILPFGVQNAHEAGETTLEGNDPAAPVKPNLGKKAIITTFVAGVIFVMVYFILKYAWHWVVEIK